MSVGRRVVKLRASHGESLREAAVRTGVSHTTIARIEKGEVTGSFHSTLRKIADGYGVRVEYLLTGRDPRQDFELAIRRMPPDDRLKLFFASRGARTKVVFDFLQSEYPGEFTEEQLALAMGVERDKLVYALETWNQTPGSNPLMEHLAQSLAQLTGIAAEWFELGSISTDSFDSLPAGTLSHYLRVLDRAVQAQVSPRALEMAIDLLITKEREAAAGRIGTP